MGGGVIMNFEELEDLIGAKILSLSDNLPLSFSEVRGSSDWPVGFIHQAAINLSFLVDLDRERQIVSKA